MEDNFVRVGIAGLGTVGVGVVKIINGLNDLLEVRSGKKIVIEAVSARDETKNRGIDLSDVNWYHNAVELAMDADIDIVVELIGGDEGIAYDVCKRALKNGKHVVTANKALIAKHGVELATLAEKHKVTLLFEAAVAGGIPVIKALKDGLAANDISKVIGIMNGTCNYILTTMQKTGRCFEDVLKEAQGLGYAEADPTFDVDGIDTAHKLVILASLAFAGKVDSDNVYIEGIRNITNDDITLADELGYVIKLLGVTDLKHNAVTQAVYPCLLSKEHPLAKVNDVFNAVTIYAEPLGNVTLEGPGAGEGATASSVVADIIDIVKGYSSFAFGVPVDKLEHHSFTSVESLSGKYYIRIPVEDEKGVLADISQVFDDCGVSMESVVQHPRKEKEDVLVVFITHEVSEKVVQGALQKLEAIPTILKKPSLIRVES